MWRANVVYATPSKAVIDAFRDRGLGDALYLVRDLSGLRFEWAREQFFGDPPGEIRHGLPARGLLAVMPPTRMTNYDKIYVINQAAWAQHEDDYGDDPALKWERVGFTGRTRIEELGEFHNRLEFPSGLHHALSDIARTTGETLMHYFCESSGGPPDVEVSFVARPDAPLETITTGDPLVTALAALGLELPTGFFALHASSFDWSRYALS